MISIVIPNFNSSEQLAKNFPKLFGLLGQAKIGHEIIVVDDASTDNSVQVIEKLIKQKHNDRGEIVWEIQLIKKEKNEGFASTVDAGIRAARGEVVFTLKTDAIPEKADYFQLMLDHFKDPKVFAVSATLKTMEKAASADGSGEPREEIRGQGVLTFFRGFFLHFRTYSDYVDWLQTMRTTRGKIPDTKYKILNTKYSMWADGGAMVVRRDLYLKIGGFDKLYNPFYWEDVDLGYRAWKAGYQIGFESRAILLHDFESGTIAQHYTKEQVKLISQRNQFLFVWKNSDFKHLISHFSFLIFHFLVALKNGNRLFFGAFYQAIYRWPEILLMRWRQKKVTKLSDDEALRMFLDKKTPGEGF